MKFKILLASLLFSTVLFAQTGKITGKVIDSDTKNPIAFVKVSVKGQNNSVDTDEAGNYIITQEKGKYIVLFSMNGYTSKTGEVTVNENETTNLNISLKENSSSIGEVVVKTTSKKTSEAALIKEQQKAVEIKQSIGAAEMERKGVSNVESGLAKVTGITKAESRGLFVRGLESRYNNLLINDLQVPSNSPFKKIIPLDLFSTDIVGVLNVYKTFNPNLPGDFAGATINIETSEAQTAQTKLSVGFGFVTNNNNTDFLISETANNNQGFFGIQKNKRELPTFYGNIGGYKLSSSEYKESYKNNSWNVDKVGAPINNSISFSHSDKIKFKNNNSFSYLISLNGDNKYQVRDGLDRNFVEGLGQYNKNVNYQQYKYLTSTSTLIGLKYKSERFQIGANSMYLRTTENLIEDQKGVFNNQTGVSNRFIRTNQFEQSDYFNNQLLTSYKITENDKHSVKGGISFVKTIYELPDRKFLDGNLNSDGTFQNSYGGNTLNRQHFKIKGNYYVSGMFEYNYKFGKEINGKTNKLALGFNTFRNSITSQYRFFSTRPISGSYTVSNDLNNINNQILSDIENGLIFEREESTADYKVKLNQFVNAGYFNLFFNLFEKFEINGGLRLETSDRTIKFRPISTSFDDTYSKLIQKKNYVLPSINSKYSINEKTNIRFAASQTITRPVLMEVLPVQFVNPDGTVETGNSNLSDTENLNLDLKYEYFSDKKDMIAAAIYGKNIQNPIERVFVPSATQITTFQNSQSANLYGVELELIYNLSNISDKLDNVSVGFNTSVMKTEVEIAENNILENNPKRELQGASNWVINADAKYEFKTGKLTKNTATLVYGVKGKNIFAVGTAGLDHIYELPFHKLDFVYSTKFTKNLGAKFSVENILNPYQRLELGEKSKFNIEESSLILREFKRGTGFSLSLSYTF